MQPRPQTEPATGITTNTRAFALGATPHSDGHVALHIADTQILDARPTNHPTQPNGTRAAREACTDAEHPRGLAHKHPQKHENAARTQAQCTRQRAGSRARRAAGEL